MTYNLVRGWAPLRGVIAGRDKYIDLPIPELYDLAGGSAGEPRTWRPAARDRVLVLTNTLRTYNVRPAQSPRAGSPPTRPRRSARSDTFRERAAPSASYTEADDPKRLVEIDRDLHTRHGPLSQDGRGDEAIAMLNSVIARRPDTADAYISLAHALLGRRAAAAGDRGARARARERRARSRRAHPARASTSPRATPTAAARSRCSKACRPKTSRR